MITAWDETLVISLICIGEIVWLISRQTQVSIWNRGGGGSSGRPTDRYTHTPDDDDDEADDDNLMSAAKRMRLMMQNVLDNYRMTDTSDDGHGTFSKMLTGLMMLMMSCCWCW